MLGDDAQPAESDGSRDRATSGPRHAAPRKSLLTKLHVPAGKAVALAAMPTAVLMGMGFTPHLAQADEMPKNPFKAGPCVTRSDTPTPSATASGSAGGKSTDKPADPTASPAPTTSPSPSAGADTPEPPATSPPATDKPDAKTAQTTPAAPAATPAPSATPSPEKTVNPLDPLGLGDVLKTLLGGDSATPAPTATPTTQAPDPAPATAKPVPTGSPSATPKAPDGSDPVAAAGKTVKKTADGTTDALSKAARSAGDAAQSAAPKATPTAAETGPQPYPCPAYDAKALAAADVEQGIPLLPDTPWVLKTTKLSLHGLAYHGIVQVRTYSGAVKDVLKFTVSGIDIDNLHQIVDGPQGTKTNVEAAKGSTSSFTGGQVTLYTESLSGNLLGLIPITFTPKAPPPLTLPELFFTNATVIQAAQFGGNLHVPGMHIYPSAS